jgi:hypothetical protein
MPTQFLQQPDVRHLPKLVEAELPAFVDRGRVIVIALAATRHDQSLRLLAVGVARVAYRAVP